MTRESKQSTHERPRMDRTNVIIVAIVVTIVLAVGVSFGLTMYANTNEPSAVEKAEQDLQDASADMIKASLDVYYVLHSRYPTSMDILKEDIATDPESWRASDASPDSMDTAIKELPGFTYEVRGDGEAYKFTYTDQRGEKRTVEGNYQEDYH